MPMVAHSHETRRSSHGPFSQVIRSNWKPYNPSMSLADNEAANPESAFGSREDEVKASGGTALSSAKKHGGPGESAHLSAMCNLGVHSR